MENENPPDDQQPVVQVTVETPTPEAAAAAPVVVVAPTAAPEASTDLAVSVGQLMAKMETMETAVTSLKYTAEEATSMARMALDRQAAMETQPETPVIAEVVTEQPVSEGAPVIPTGRRSWFRELFI